MVCYDEALRIARRHRLPEQAARIATFYATYYQRAGKHAVASAYYNDAMRYCREFKAGRHEIRFVIWGMQAQAELGCWEAVEKLIQRARVLEKRFDPVERSGTDSQFNTRSYYRVIVDAMEMWWLLARGDVSGARKIHDNIHGYVKKYTKRGEYASFLYGWAEGLANNGYFSEAAGIVAAGLSFCRETTVTDWRMKFVHLSARVSFGEGMALEALENARLFDEQYTRSNDGLRHKLKLVRQQNLVTRARAHLSLGDTLSADSTLSGALRELDKSVSETPRSVGGYLWLGRCSDVRELLFDMTERNPFGGYGTALYWQSLGRKLGGQTQQSFAVPVTKETVVRAGTKTAEAVRSRGATHIVYGIRGNGVWRWTARDGVVVAEMLEVPGDVLQNRVRETIGLMSQDPGDPNAPVAAELARTLRLLAGDLLPRPLLEPEDALPTPSLIVTTDGFLGRLPFGALNVGSGDTYEPLLSRIDVVYYRHTGSNSRPGTPWSGDGIVFVVSNPSRYARSRFPLSGVLPGAEREGDVVASAFPRLRRYSGETATKTNLVGSWEHSSILYFASHVYRDPEIPYVTLIPMGALDGDGDPESAFLEIFDIRAADLHKCRVVVLSGCSSGAPTLMQQNSVPGLGEIFLDSGAGATIQTFWDIRDRDESSPMPGVVARWQESGPGDAGILCDEQRRLLRGPRGFRHPFFWAPYFFTLGNL
jgi:hypothetical protein